jgi:3-methylfumaryl-CoA hydratase
MTSPELDLGHLRTWIGREDAATAVVTLDLVQRFFATFDLAHGTPGSGAVVPRLIHFCLAPPLTPTSSLGEDGHPTRGGFLPPVPLPRRMWAGGLVSFSGDLHLGDAVRRVSRIADVVGKKGRTGPLCFVTVEHTVEADGAIALRERQDIVYRGFADARPERHPEAAKAGVHRRKIAPSPPLLFRYSALTFNAHRIHYDRSYATGVEHYPGLIVHGPLQATQLFNYATELRGSPPSRFSFRSFSPLFDTADYFLNAEEVNGELHLWTARDGGPIAMRSEAAWS